MPIYEYVSESPDDPDLSCRVCAKGFELRRPIDREDLVRCPICKHPVKKVVSRVNTPKVTKPFSAVDAKKAGFKVMEKRCDGSYESI